MFGWNRKSREIEDAAKPELVKIEFRSDDTMHQRAEKIFYALGFANDRMNFIPKVAGWLSMYKEWDDIKAHRVNGQQTKVAEV